MQFLSKSFPEIENHIITATASLSIIVSVASSIMSYMKIPESMTRNELSLVEWQNFHTTLQHQLSLSRHERTEPEEFMKWVKVTYDQLFKISPVCRQKFITQTKKKIRKGASDKFQTPNWLNGFTHAKIWKDENDDFEDNSL
jgi:hypothetical protein